MNRFDLHSGGQRPTLGGRTHHSGVAPRRGSAKRPFGAQPEECALPGGGSGYNCTNGALS